MIKVAHLSKSYGSVRAVVDVSFSVARGEVVGFLGPNGAGKSTTLRILAGFLGPTSGSVSVGGHDIVDEPILARRLIGYMPETSPLYPEMRVGEYLAFRAELKRVARKDRRDAVRRALAEARIEDMEDVIIGHLSKGYRQRVGLADALVSSPPILILDEPTAGLDPNQIREVRELVRALGKDRAVLVSTHILSEVEATCARALVIARGKLVAEGSIDEIRAMRRGGGVRVSVRGEGEAAAAIARKVAGVKKVKRDGGGETIGLSIEIGKDADVGRVTEEIVAALAGAGLGVREVAPRLASLEQVFSALTQDEPATGAEVEA